MPHIEIKLFPGYGEEKKRELTQSILEAVSKDLDVPRRVISVAFEEIPKDQWQEKVYEPLIAGRKGLAAAPDYQ